MPHRLPLALALLVLATSAAACGRSDPAALRAAEIEAILKAHLAHEGALIDILEQHRDDPVAAEAGLKAYLDEHGAEMSALCEKRRRLESEPAALATAMRDLEPEMSRVFERRRALADNFPELMAREEVRTALSALDAL